MEWFMMQQAAQYQPVQYKPAHDDINWQLLVQVGSEFYKEKEVSDECWTAMAQCSNQTMTTGRCKSVARDSFVIYLYCLITTHSNPFNLQL